jgi:hypothetical protein
MHPTRCGLIVLGDNGELETAVAGGLEQSGAKVQLLTRSKPWDIPGCDVLIALGPMHSMAWAIARLAAFGSVLPPLAVWFTEQVPAPWWPTAATRAAAEARYALERAVYQAGLGQRLLRDGLGRAAHVAGRLRAIGELLALRRSGVLRVVCAFTESTRRALAQHGLPSIVLPMGYHPTFGAPLALERDIDVIFLGSTRDRRRGPLVEHLHDELTRRGISFVVRDGSRGRGYAFGAERTELVNRSKIMLNLMRQPWDDAVFRMLLAAPNGAMLLSENIVPTGFGPFRPGEHFAMAPIGDLVRALEHFLVHREEREQIARAARQLTMSELTMANMAGLLLHHAGV